MGKLNGNDVFFCRLTPEVWENARRKDRASFFEEEGLNEFLHLEWDIKVDRNQVLEFLDNYDMKSRTVSMSTGVFKIDEKLVGEVFHLPSGDYKMPRRKTSAALDLPYFTVGQETKSKYYHTAHCTDQIWKDRFVFLRKVFCGTVSMPRYFMEFVHAKGEKRNWLDAFWWFFKEEIRRIRGPQSRVLTAIGTRISLLLAHVHTHKAQGDIFNRPKDTSDCVNIYLRRKRRPEVCHGQERVTQEHQTPKIDPKYKELSSSTDEELCSKLGLNKTLTDDKNSDAGKEVEEEAEEQQGEDEKKEAAKHEGETDQDELVRAQKVNPSLNAREEEDEILNYFDVGRKMVVGLRADAELWKSEYYNRSVVEAQLRVEIDSLKTDKEKWKGAFESCATCMEVLRKENGSLKNENDSLTSEVEKLTGQLMRAEKAQVELGKIATVVQTKKDLGTTKTTSRQAVPEDNSSIRALYKKMKMEDRDDKFASS